MFTIQELQAISTLLLRVDLKGNEALTVAQLQLKVSNLIKQQEVIPATTEENKTEAPTE